MFGLISWLIISLIMGLTALSAVWSRRVTRWRLLTLSAFLMTSVVSGGAILLSQGWSSSCSFLLPGKYTVLGIVPVPEEAIYVFLQTTYGPKVCHAPWDIKNEEKLRQAIEGEKEMEIEIGGDGGGSGGSGGFEDAGDIQFWPKPITGESVPKAPQDNGALF